MHILASFCTANEEFFYKCRSKYCAFRFIYYVELPTKSIFLAFPFNYVPCGFIIFSPDLIGIFLIANHSIITYVLTFYFLSFSRINK